MAVLYFLCSALLIVTAKAQCLPRPAPCQTPVVTTNPIVATTVVDNSVSNSLANALQLLIVSNLIENTMTLPCGCGCGLNTLPALAPALCDTITVPASMYAPTIDVLPAPFVPYDPIPVVSPCDFIPPCEPVIEVIPNGCYSEVIQVPACGCEGPFMPNIGCGNCGYDGPFMPNFAPSCGCGNCGCGCTNSLSSILTNILPTIGCGCKNYGCDMNPFGPRFGCGCDRCEPMIPEIFPGGFGIPNLPMAVNVDPFVYEPCPNRCFGNGFYY